MARAVLRHSDQFAKRRFRHFVPIRAAPVRRDSIGAGCCAPVPNEPTHSMPVDTPYPALLALADGTLWPGVAFGARGERTGEVVFNTSLTGYQEILTDPSYHGYIVVMSQPHIGNYGTNPED